jgi:hypothetical protein
MIIGLDGKPIERRAGGRQCGECKVCCFAMEVSLLDKPMFKACTYQTVKDSALGCNRYETRPMECQNFSCLWLHGVLEPEYKPSLCGFVVFVSNNKELIILEMAGGVSLLRFEPHIRMFLMQGVRVIIQALPRRKAEPVIKVPSLVFPN